MSHLFVQTEVFTEVLNFCSCFPSFFCYLKVMSFLYVCELCMAYQKQGNAFLGLVTRDQNFLVSFHQGKVTLSSSTVVCS